MCERLLGFGTIDGSKYLVPLRHNKLSTVVVGTSNIHTVKQGTGNSVRVWVVKCKLNVVIVNLDRAMSYLVFDSRQICV
jgi:hypothetical protein